MNTAFYIGLGLIFLFIIAIAVGIARDQVKERKDYPFKHKKRNDLAAHFVHYKIN